MKIKWRNTKLELVENAVVSCESLQPIMRSGYRAVLLFLALNCGTLVLNVKGLAVAQTTQEIRKEDLEVIDELESEEFNDLNLKEIQTLLSLTDNGSPENAVKNSHIENNSTKKKQMTVQKQETAEQASTQDKTSKPETTTVEKNSQSKNSDDIKSNDKNTGKGSTKNILDAIIHRILSQHHRKALGGSRKPTNPGSDETKKAGTLKTKTLLGSKNAKITDNSHTKAVNNASMERKTPSKKDSMVFARLESIAHNILRVLKHRQSSKEGSKLREKINRDDLLKIRDFIKTTRDPKIARKAKVRSAKEALVAIKNLLKLIKRTKLDQVKAVEDNDRIGNALKAVNMIHSDAFMKSKVPVDDKKVHEKHPEISSETKTILSSDMSTKDKKKSDNKHDKKYYLNKLKELRIKLLKEKLLKVLKLKKDDHLNFDLQRLKSKLEKQVKQEKREKRDEEQDEQDKEQEMREKQGKLENPNKRRLIKRKQTRVNKNEKLKSATRSHRINKKLRNIIQKKIQKLNIITKKEESDVERGTKRFLLIHGPKSFRKNLISLADLDANKMTDEDLERLHEKINEWIEVEEKLERQTENGETKDEISSGIAQANDLISSLQLADGMESKERVQSKPKVENSQSKDNVKYENKGNVENFEINAKNNENGNRKKQIEVVIDVNKQGKNNPYIKIEQDNKVDDRSANINTPNNQASNMYNGNPYAAVTNPSDKKYLKEIANAYMDGKAIKENRNFGDNLKTLEKNFETNVNNLENSNIVNDNIPNNENTNDFDPNVQNEDNIIGSSNQNDINPSVSNNAESIAVLDQSNTQENKPSLANENGNTYDGNKQNKQLGNDQNVNHNDEKIHQPSNSASNNKISEVSGNNPQGSPDRNNNGNGDNFINKVEPVNNKLHQMTNSDSTNNNKISEISGSNPQDHTTTGKEGNSGNLINKVEPVNHNEQTNQMTNSNSVSNNNKVVEMSGSNPQDHTTTGKDDDSGNLINKVEPANNNEKTHQMTTGDSVSNNNNVAEMYNPQKSREMKKEGNSGNFINKDANSNMNSNTVGNNLNGIPNENEEKVPLNGGMVANENQVNDENQVTNTGPAINEGQVTNGGQANVVGKVTNGDIANGDQVANGDQITKGGEVTNEGKVANEQMLPNGHVVTYKGQVTNEDAATNAAASQQTHHDNDNPATNNKQGQEHINEAASQLANTMNQENPQSVTNTENGTPTTKPHHPKDEHHTKVSNPDYDDKDYDYSEADEEEADDQENITEQKRLPKHKTPFLQADKLNKPMQQHNPTNNEPNNVPQPNLQGKYGGLNEVQQNTNQNHNIKNSRHVKFFHHVGTSRFHPHGNSLAGYKLLNAQQFNGNGFGAAHRGYERMRNTQRESNYHHDLGIANSGHRSDQLEQINPSVQKLSREENYEQSNSIRVTPTPTQTSNYDSNVEVGDETESNEHTGMILNGKEIKDDTLDENEGQHFKTDKEISILNGKEMNDEREDENDIKHVKTDQAELPYQNEDTADVEQNEKPNTGDKTSEEDATGDGNPVDVTLKENNTPGEDPKAENDAGNKSPHGKMLLNNFLDEENVNHEQDSSHQTKNAQSVPQGSNKALHNVQLLPVNRGEAESNENDSDEQDSDPDVPQFSAKPMDPNDGQIQSNLNIAQKMHHAMSLKHPHKTKAHHILNFKHENYKPAPKPKMKTNKQVKSTHIKNRLVLKWKEAKPKLVVNLQKIPDADAFIRGAMRSIPSQVIHIMKPKPKLKPVAQNSDAKIAKLSNETAMNDATTSVMPKLRKVQLKVHPAGKKTATKPMEEQAASKDQQSSTSAVSTSGDVGTGGGGGGGMDTSGGGMDTSGGSMNTNGISIPSSQVAAQSFVGENKVSNMNANDMSSSDGTGMMPSSSDADKMMSSSDADKMMSSSAADKMMSSNDMNKMTTSTDPTDLTEYEHKIDLAERTSAGDIVPFGLNVNSPSVAPVPNIPGKTSTSAPPEHVLLSHDSAKGEDLLKPLAQDPDGKLAAMQDLQALTKVQKEQENTATQDTEKISDPAFLEGMSNRISVSGSPLDSLGMTNTPSMPLRDIDQPGATLMVPGEKLKRDEKGSPENQGNPQESGKIAQFTVDNKVVALGPKAGPKGGQLNAVPQVHQLAGNTPESRLATPAIQTRKPANEGGLRATPSSTKQTDISYNLAPRIKELVKEIIRESTANKGNALSKKKPQDKSTEAVFNDQTKYDNGDILLKSERMETKPFDASPFLKNLGIAGKGAGVSSQRSSQSQIPADKSKETLFLPNVPGNPESNQVFFDGKPHPTGLASTMDELSKTNLSNEEKIKLIKAYRDGQKTTASPDVSTRNKPSKSESAASASDVDESKIKELLKNGKFTEHDLKSDFAGKEAAMQDMVMLEKEQDMDDKLSQARLMTEQPSKQKGPGNGLTPGSQQDNAVSSALPGNLSPDITFPGNISPGATLPGTLPAGNAPSGNGLSPETALPENRLPGAGTHAEQMSGFLGGSRAGISPQGNGLSPDVASPENRVPGAGTQGQMPAFTDGLPKDDASMMAMDKLLDQAQAGGLSKDFRGENTASYGIGKSRKVPVPEELHNGLNDEMKSIDNNIESNQPNYDAVNTGTSNGIEKFVDSVQGLSPAEVKAYGIDVNNDVYIDKPARQRSAAQRPFQGGYTSIGGETGLDMETFGGMKKSHVNRKKTEKKLWI